MDAALKEIISRDEPVPKPARLPTPRELALAESELGVPFHPDLRRYLLEASNVTFGAIEPVTITDAHAHTHLHRVAMDAWSAGVDRTWVPVCEDNSDYYCVRPDGQVAYWSHDGTSTETWSDLAAWIRDVWIAEGCAA